MSGDKYFKFGSEIILASKVLAHRLQMGVVTVPHHIVIGEEFKFLLLIDTEE